MRTIFILTLIIIPSFLARPTLGQVINTPPNYARLDTTQLKAQKKVVKNREKTALKKEVIRIEQELNDGKITKVQAEQMKKAAALKHAKNIKNQLSIINAYIALMKRNGLPKKAKGYHEKKNHLHSFGGDTVKTVEKPSRTHSHLTIAFGLNNAIGKNQSLNDSPYKIGGSRFFEIGYEFSTALIKSGYLRLNYGINFQFNGLKPNKNRYFVQQNNRSKLEPFPLNLRKAKLRQDNFVIPVYVEIGPTDKSYRSKKIRIGLGGFAGLNLRTIQKLKYNTDQRHVKRRELFSSTTNNVIYGLSAYIGHNWVEFYINYDLNTIFKDNPVKQHNISAGLRLALF